jgi:hypothetical protein
LYRKMAADGRRPGVRKVQHHNGYRENVVRVREASRVKDRVVLVPQHVRGNRGGHNMVPADV